MLLATEQHFRKQQQFFFDLLPEGEVDFGLDPSWVKIYPYQAIAANPGRTENTNGHGAELPAVADENGGGPGGPARMAHRSRRPEVRSAGRESKAAHDLHVTIPRSWTPRSSRFAIAADVMRDGKYLGQITEAVVEVAG